MRKLLLRVPALRWCVLQHLRQVRHKRREAAWLYTQGILSHLGEATISWAGINLILNRFIEAHHTQIGNIAKNGLPRNFTSKLEYLRKVEQHQGWGVDRSAELRVMRLELAALNEKRVNLTHGLLMRQGYGPTFTIHIAKEVADSLFRQTIPYSGQEIVEFSKELSEMGGRLSRFFMFVIAK
jgi:hypothetical protein